MTAPNTTNNVTVRKLANVAEGMWNKSKNAFVNASGDTMTGRLTLENAPINQFITGTGTVASSSGGNYYPAKWTFDIGISTPNPGDLIIIKSPCAGHSYGVFVSTDNGTTYFPVADGVGSGRLTTRFGKDSYIPLVFESHETGDSDYCGVVSDIYPLTGGTVRTKLDDGCWRVLTDYDSGNYYERLHHSNSRFYAGDTGCYPYSLVFLDKTGRFSTLVTSNPGASTTNKAINTAGKFVYPATAMYYAKDNTASAGALVSYATVYTAYPSVDIRYSCNYVAANFTTHKPIYVECTLNGDGTWSPTSNNITQTLVDGKYYIYLGTMYSDKPYLTLDTTHPMYYYTGTELVSAEVARGDITAGTNNGELNVAGTDITVYTHPTDAGNKHIPAGGSSGQFLGYDSDGTAKWVANPNTDTKVKATAKTDNVNYKILATASASPTSGAATEAVYDTDITLNPSTNTISANVSGTAASAGKLTTARTTYVTLGTASTSTTRDWSGTTTIPVSGTLGLGNGGTGATSAAGARTNLDVYSKSETESLLNGKVVIVTVLPATGEAGTTYYVKDTSSSGVDKYDEYIWAVDAGATTESWIHVGEKSLDLSEYVNSLTTSGTGPLVKSLSKSSNALTATLGTIAIDNLSDWASSTDVTVSSVTYHTWWPVAPTSSNQVYGLSIYNGRLYRVYNNKGSYSVQEYDKDTTYTNKSLGQGYGTCATEAATAAKIVTMSDYALTIGGIVTVKFTNALCASATMSINGKTAKPIYIKGAAVTANNAATVSAGDTAYFMYDGTAYHLLGTDRAATNPIVNISRSGTTFTATRLDGTTFTFTQQDNNTTYTQAKLGQGYGTCTTAEATAAKSVTLTGYELEPNGVVAVKFTNGLCASATMSINGKTATPIYINGAAVTTTSCKEVLAGDLAFFIYDGSHYQFICTDRISKNGITGLSISGRTITYTRADGTTGTLTTQDTTYSFDGTYNASTNKAATVSTVTNAVNALDVDDITGFGAGKTLATLTETDGKIAATFQNISITKSQVSDFSHSHGNITNDGQIQSASDTAIAADDKIIVADKSNGNKLVRSSVTFDGSTTTTALTPKGTWEAFAKAEDITSAIEAAIDNKAAKPVRLTFTLPVAPSGGTSVKYVKITATGGDYRQWLCSYNENISSRHSTWLFRSYSTGESSRDNVTLIKNGPASERQWYCAAANTWYVKFTNTATTSSFQIVFNVTAIDTSTLPTLEAVDTMPDTATEITVYGVTKAEQLRTARQLAVSLSNTGTTTTFDGTANVTNIKVSGTLGVGNGGTGKASVTAGNYLVGNGSSALTEKTPAQVLSDIGAQAALSFEGTYNASTNKAATVSTVTNAIDALDAEVTSSDGTNVNVKVTETNGKVTAVNVTTDTTANIANSVYYVVGTLPFNTYSASATYTKYESGAYTTSNACIYNNYAYYCSTAITTAEAWNSAHWTRIATVVFTVSIPEVTDMVAGLKIAFKFPCYGGSTSTQLAINTLAAKDLRRNTGNITTHVPPNAVAFFAYNGTYWSWADYYSDSWVTSMGAYCETAAGTAAKTATSSNTVLTAGMAFLTRFTNSNTYAGKLTLNVNSQGAKDVYINGSISSSTNYTLPAGEHWCFYDGTYWYIWTNGTVQFKGVHADSYEAKYITDANNAIPPLITTVTTGGASADFICPSSADNVPNSSYNWHNL